jgi:hypothetical protein
MNPNPGKRHRIPFRGTRLKDSQVSFQMGFLVNDYSFSASKEFQVILYVFRFFSVYLLLNLRDSGLKIAPNEIVNII